MDRLVCVCVCVCVCVSGSSCAGVCKACGKGYVSRLCHARDGPSNTFFASQTINEYCSPTHINTTEPAC